MDWASDSGIYHKLGEEDFTWDRRHQLETSAGRDAACETGEEGVGKKEKKKILTQPNTSRILVICFLSNRSRKRRDSGEEFGRVSPVNREFQRFFHTQQRGLSATQRETAALNAEFGRWVSEFWGRNRDPLGLGPGTEEGSRRR